MIRWYDYLIAVIMADLMLGLILAGFNSTLWWEPLVFGFLAGFVFRMWEKEYCRFRLRQENKN
jgi:hypothetical protein